ncbi:hypothetical protein Bhyg_12616 [Pseudolycoriella hygida]|uniref:Uncharacterized protein n=1 Tax=Pseudolycoriella hygida TaxID=35572 RepID=A0A9Q0MYN1_9DIPT|nr:hypothetical protein Bhyg_12616 [Pseudolycoriella hygida]
MRKTPCRGANSLCKKTLGNILSGVCEGETY